MPMLVATLQVPEYQYCGCESRQALEFTCWKRERLKCEQQCINPSIYDLGFKGCFKRAYLFG